MTTFEITTIALLAVIMLMVIILVKTAIGGFHDVWQQLNANWEQLRKIETHEDISTSVIIELMDIVDKMHRNLCVEIADKMVDRIYPDKESMNKIDWDKLSKEQQDEFLKRLIMPNYDNPFQPPFNPTCETTNNSEDVYAECRRMDAINTASVCENMTKIQE